MLLPSLLGSDATPPLWAFIIFYGLDWVATVPPTIVIARERYGVEGPIVFGWIFTAHQAGAAVAATGAGLVRDELGNYVPAFLVSGALCFVAALASGAIPAPGPTAGTPAANIRDLETS